MGCLKVIKIKLDKGQLGTTSNYINGNSYPFQESSPDLRSLGVEGDCQVAVVAGVLKILLGGLPGVGDGLEDVWQCLESSAKKAVLRKQCYCQRLPSHSIFRFSSTCLRKF